MHHRVSIIGKLGRDVELHFAPDGKEIANFSVAVTDPRRKKTIWFRIVTFGNTAANCDKYLLKGDTVAIDGRLEYDQETGGPKIWTTKDGVAKTGFDLVADNVVFISTKPKESVDEEDDLPF